MNLDYLQKPLTADDWIVTIRYIAWNGKEKSRSIGVHPMNDGDLTEEQAKQTALNSLRRKGQLPPKIKDVRARRRYQIGVEKTINRAKALVDRFARD